MTQQIVLATGNAGKVREIQAVLGEWDIQVRPQSEFQVAEAEETGLTFVENAIIKARNAATHTGLPAIGDDSGLEVDYLKGEPGIYSSRYAGENATDRENNEKLLRALQGVEQAQRRARFYCVIVYLEHARDPTPVICQGSWEGFISLEPKGSNGFGYDPLFYVPSLRCHAAELDSQTKNRLSHRGQAIRKLAEYFHASGK